MTQFSEFTCFLAKNDTDSAISFFRKNEGDILREYRRLLEEENYDEYWEQDHTVFDDLVNSRLSKGDEAAEDVIRRLLSERVFLNEPTPDGFTPVSLLAYSGRFDLVRHAIECGAEINKGIHPALTGAVYNRELPQQWEQIVTFLLDHGADPNGSTGSKPPLFPAIASNHREAIRLLASRGADVNRIHDIPSWGDFSGTALHWAVRSAYTDHTNLETAKLLLELGGDPTIKNKSGYGPVDFAFDKDYEENENVRPLIELLSSKDEWRRSSWRLNQASPFRDNPIRKKPNPRSDYRDLKWGGVEYRIGDRVQVINPIRYTDQPWRPDGSGQPVHDRQVGALPGLTGTVVRFDSFGRSDWERFAVVVDMDPGAWEECDSYGKTVFLPKCRFSVHPEKLKIIEIEENLRGRETFAPRMSGGQPEKNDEGASGLNWKLVAGVAVALVILFLVIR